ncbi:MAG: Flp pilus assembly protein CpaB [Gammaproteobacteria bacterium]|nr:Flp pilus assembly protein CpaB [Gammaproteobacteria bacterium]MDE2250259.1 Flp pilus assembly protein CpaB [Gammaproteobacteria bacterium]
MGWKSWMLDRNVLFTAAAVACGMAAYLLAHRYLQGAEAAARRQLAGDYATRDALVAAQPLPAGSVIEPAMLAQRAVPERFMASDALAAEGAAAVVGRRLGRALASGEVMTASALAAENEVELSSLVEQGWRALTIPVDESSAAAGLIDPGDYVDLLLATSGDGNGSRAQVRPLLQAVRVVATGQRMLRRRGTGGDREAVPAESTYATVTLRLPPEDAERVLLAQRLGELAVLLRPAGDAEPLVLRAVDQSQLFGAAETRRGAVLVSRVEFIVGGVGGSAHARTTAALANAALANAALANAGARP